MKKLLTFCAAIVAAMTMNAAVTEMTCAAAAQSALAMTENATADDSVSVVGYITSTNGIISREQQTFYMDDTKGSGTLTLQAYWANLPADDKETPLAVGDKIILKGKLMHYYNSVNDTHIAEIKNGDVIVLERNTTKVDTIEVDACEAIEKGLTLAVGAYSEDVYQVSGVVGAVDNTNDADHSQTFWLQCTTREENFKAYECKVIGDYVAIGDTVSILGKLCNYSGIIEIFGGDAWIVSKYQPDTIIVTVAKALAIAQSLGNNVSDKDMYRVTGYVDSIRQAYSETYDNISFFMCDDLSNPQYDFVAYRVKGGAEISVGAKVTVIGSIMHYYKAGNESVAEEHVYELAAGATIESIKRQVAVQVGVDLNSQDMGTVSGSGIFYQGDAITVTATANSGYHFVAWSDENKEPVRVIKVTNDMEIYAIFAPLCGNDLYWLYDNHVLSIYGSGAMDIETYNNQTWHSFIMDIQTVTMPDQLSLICNEAFIGAKYLSQVTIPAGVTSIGRSAFEECRSMDSVIFAGNNVQEIGDWAFYNCHSLRSLTLPEGVEEIGRAAFFDCTYLNELTLPSTMKKIADNGFAGCEKIKTMYVNVLVPPTIEAKTFEDVDRATPVFVPKGTLERYQADEYWSEFFNMAEYEAPTGNLSTSADNDANALRKVLRNGQVLILRGDKTYTIMGQKVE